MHTEAEEDFDRELVKVRVSIGKRSTMFTVNNIDVDHVQSDSTVRRKVEGQIQDALAKIS